ncbi:hypothetical protein EYF80_045313 [Liparis tanakae]|uniref:Uncharacterized protein n=1 Tax=Liparis tanakae TaxID=230148 RepID=A0A4Z2FTZ5_9TELE|nr:hypothetical protein EYF80_045313 [Liparis tanakae]
MMGEGERLQTTSSPARTSGFPCRHSLFSQAAPQKPARHTHAPVSLRHVSLLGQCVEQLWLQWRPQWPSEHGALQRAPGATTRLVLMVPAPRWTPPLTPPARQTAALPGGRLAAVGVETVAPLQAARPKRARLTREEQTPVRGGISNSLKHHQQAKPRRLTGHGCSHSAPCQPAAQAQDPSAGSHLAPLAQRQVALQPGPQEPWEQGAEQSGPRQPATRGGQGGIESRSVDGQSSVDGHRLWTGHRLRTGHRLWTKHVPSTGEQSTAFLQEHPREQFFPVFRAHLRVCLSWQRHLRSQCMPYFPGAHMRSRQCGPLKPGSHRQAPSML